MTYTVLGALIGQVLPFFIAMTATRAVGLRFTRASLVGSGTGASVLEQGFDLIVPLVLVLPGLLVASRQISFETWAKLSIALLVVCGAGVAAAGGVMAALIGRDDPAVSADATAVKKPTRRLGKAWFDPRVLLAVFWLSVIRYANLVLRAQILAYALVGDDLRRKILYAMPLIQLSNLAALTPGGLGITEWTWTGALTVLGSGLAEAAQFGLAYPVMLHQPLLDA